MNIAQNIVLSIFTLVSTTLNGQVYNIVANNGQTITPACTGASFSDDGANSTHYSNGLNNTITFCAPAGKLLKFDFGCGSNLTIERIHPTDTLYIYNGSSSSSPLMYALTGNAANSNRLPYFDELSDAQFVAPSQCITFKFVSNGASNEDGWDACIRCVDPVSCSTNNPPPSDLFGGAPLVCNLNGYCGTTLGDFGTDTPFNMDANGGACPSSLPFLGTIENNSWIKFIASAPTAIFDFSVPLGGGCANGVQTAIFSFNGSTLTRVSPCALSDGSHSGNFSLTGTGLTIGETYYLMIDGNAGDVCNYTIKANTGVTTVSAGADKNLCPGNSTSFTANGPAGATYTWKDLSGNVIGTGLTYNTPILNANTSYIVEVTNGPCLTSKDTVQALIVCALPVELIDFNGSCISNKVDLNWQTASERNNSYFSIYRAGANGNYQLIGVVNGNGNSTTLSNYQYIDNDPFVGINYYKITQTDFNGATDELKTISVWHDCSNIRHSNIDTYYNSETNQIVFGYDFDKDENITIELVDAVGNIVYSNQMYLEKNLNKASVSLDKSLATGVYLVRCSNAHFTFTGKVYLNK